MTKNIKKLISGLVSAVLLLGVASCNSSDGGKGIIDNPLYDFATLTAVGDNGSTFEVIKSGDAQPVYLTSNIKVDTKIVPVGQRLLITYQPTDGISYQSGPIDLYRYQQVINGDVETGTAAQWEAWRTQDVSLYYFTRTGKYLNAMVNVFVLNAPKTFTLVADEATLDDEYPVLHMIFISDTSMDGSMRTGYASWNIAKVWDRPTCKGVKVLVANIAGDKSYTFTKDKAPITPAE